VHDNLQRFASVAGNDYSDSNIYVQSYAAIECAFTAYADLPQEKGYSEEEYDNSLSILLLELKSLMFNDKEKVEVAFKDTDGSKLIFKIAEDFNDKESIRKVLDLLKLE